MSIIRTFLVRLCFLSLFCLVLLPSRSFGGTPVVLHDNSGRYALAPYLEVLEDKNSVFTIDDVTGEALSDKFIPYQKESAPNFGLTGSVYWVRFVARDDTTTVNHDWFLEIALPTLDKVELYAPLATGGFSLKQAGRSLPFKARDIEHRNLVFNLPHPLSGARTFYLRFASEDMMVLPLALWKKEAFFKRDHIGYLLLGLYYGLMAVMVVYNLFIYFSLKDRNYLFYVLYVVSYAAVQMELNGIAYEFLWPDQPWWNHRADAVMGCFMAFWAIQFARSFLSTKEFVPKLDTALLVLMGFSVFASAASLLVPYSVGVGMAFTVAIGMIALIIPAGVFCWRKGYRPAKFFTIAWFFLLGGILLFVCMAVGLIPFNGLTWYGPQIGGAIEIVLFSLALADRIKILREEKEAALRREKEFYEERERLSREIHDGIGSSFVKAVMLTEAIEKEVKSEDNRENIEDLKRTLSEGLADSRELVRETEEHENTLGDLVSALREKTRYLTRSDIRLHVHAALEREDMPVSPNIKLNIVRIVQEAITNILKHSGATQIDLYITEANGEIILRVRDNGKGFEPLPAHAGHGLKNMQKRCEAIGARLSIKSGLSQGTELGLVLASPWPRPRPGN